MPEGILSTISSGKIVSGHQQKVTFRSPEKQYENTANLLIIKGGGGRVSLDGVAARGLVNGRDPRRSRGRDEVGTCSDGTKPNLPYRHFL